MTARCAFRFCAALTVGLTLAACSSQRHVPSGEEVRGALVLSQVYGGRGRAGGYKSDFVELFNRGRTPISIEGVQLVSTRRLSPAGHLSYSATLPNVVLEPGSYFLVKLGDEELGRDLTLFDYSPEGSPWFDVFVDGRVLLLPPGADLRDCLLASCSEALDRVAYGREASVATPLPSPTDVALFRKDAGCSLTNGDDFEARAPEPRTTDMPSVACPSP
jgi:uncharacterized protein